MNDIAAQQTRAALRLSLENLPVDINETYEKAMQRILSDHRPLAKDIFLWITHSLRPMTALELRHALAMSPRNKGMKTTSDVASHEHCESDILAVCAGLVTIDTETAIVRLVHPTAKLFFKSWFIQTEAHASIATACLRYLRLEVVSSPPNTLHFLSYAGQYWGNHARVAQDAELNQLVVGFLNQKSRPEYLHTAINLHHCGNMSPLWIAAHFGLYDVVYQLLKANPSTITERTHGIHAIHAAAEMGHVGIVKLLLEEDGEALSDVKDADGRTPLSLGAENGHDGIVKHLLASAAVDPDSKSMTLLYEGRTPLSWAAGNGHVDIVKALLSTKKVDINSTIAGLFGGRTPLSWAAGNGHEQVVSLILAEENADSRKSDKDNRSPMSYAAQNGHEAVARLLLQADPEPSDEKDEIYGRRPVEWALDSKYVALARLLLTYPSIESRDHDGLTSLSREAGKGHIKGVEILIEMKADVNSKDDRGWTPLAYAAWGGHSKVVQILIQAGAHPDLPDNEGRTPISHAAENGRDVVVSLLLSLNSVDPDSQVNQGIYIGRTPLSFAAAAGRAAIVKMLLKKGVSNERKGTLRDGIWYVHSPREWAQLNERNSVIKLLDSESQHKKRHLLRPPSSS